MATFSGTGLSCVRGERLVFEGLDFTLDAGALFELRGANGSGKSSLLRMMAGLLPPAGGQLTWNGTPIGADRDAHRLRLSYVGHLDGVKAALTVAENLAFWMRYRGGTADAERLSQALDTFSIAGLADMPVRALSAGQRRRVALARLIACPAPLWLLDEPATALDADAAAALDHAIAAHLGGGGMVAMATHAPEARAVPRLDLDRFAPRGAEAAA